MKAPTPPWELSLLDADMPPFLALRLSRQLGRRHRMNDRPFRIRRLLGQG
jgi:hypothetical protein